MKNTADCTFYEDNIEKENSMDQDQIKNISHSRFSDLYKDLNISSSFMQEEDLDDWSEVVSILINNSMMNVSEQKIGGSIFHEIKIDKKDKKDVKFRSI
jgi:hypothetical protein